MRPLISPLLAVTAIGLAFSAEAQTGTERFDLSVGPLTVGLEAPADWQYVQRDAEHVFKNRIEQIHVLDSGPVTREGFVREIRQARRLFLGNEFDEATELLYRLPLRTAFPSEAQWQAVEIYWNRISRFGFGQIPEQRRLVEEAYAEVLRQVAALPTRGLESLAMGALDALEPMDRRDVRTQRHVNVDGRLGLLVETWDRLSHRQPTRYVFVPSGDSLFIIRTGLGDFAKLEAVFEALVESAEFH